MAFHTLCEVLALGVEQDWHQGLPGPLGAALLALPTHPVLYSSTAHQRRALSVQLTWADNLGLHVVLPCLGAPGAPLISGPVTIRTQAAWPL